MQYSLLRYLVLILISIIFTQAQKSDMTQFLGAKEPHSFVAYSFLVYDYAYDTQVDI
jgi:hypothetical protein